MNTAIFLLTASFAASDSNISAEENFARGVEQRMNAAEAKPWFRKAAEDFDHEWIGWQMPEVALARGRAKYLAGDLPGAIAAFRAGLQRCPADRDLQRGLQYCRTKVVTPNAAAIERPRELRSRFDPWERFAFFGGSLFFLSIGSWSRFTIRHRLTWQVIFLGSLGLMAAGLLEWQCQREETRDLDSSAYVVKIDVPLRTGNGESYPPRLGALLPLGTEVREVARRGGWLQIKLESGELGWVSETSLVKVE